MPKRTFLPALLLCAFCTGITSVFAQPTWTIDLLGKEKKPEKFENRKLGSEKMADKKFTLSRRFFQNNFTHYNYYYNANNKINAVLERAKANQKDDYSRLLSYYPFTLDNTASQKSELDSVIYKATAGILLHDLRNDWVDNMYLLMGKAFFLRKDFDSAAATFQFINYNLFPRKKGEDDSRVVGTRDDATTNVLSIANKEKQNVLQKVTAQPPSRNDALIWLARTLIELDEMGEAAGLISTLQLDPNLPVRLHNDLDDVYAYWFFKQNMYDSAAVYLEKALTHAETKQDMSRSEFLLAQLYEITGKFDKATEYYEKVSVHTVDAPMDIHARLNNAKMRKSTNPEELDRSIATLVGMAKKDKFESFRDIIFYSAADLAMQKPDTNAAISYFQKSIEYNENNISYRNRAFLQLADIAYERKNYKLAYAMYDSLQTGDTSLNDRLVQIQERRNGLVRIVEKILIIEREDSLQHIAAMAPADRDKLLKQMERRHRKELGLKEAENDPTFMTPAEFANKGKAPVDLFNSGAKGEWYFHNAAIKSKGFSDFKKIWGARKNVDNWRRKNAGTNAAPATGPTAENMTPEDIDRPVDPAMTQAAKATAAGEIIASMVDQPVDMTYEGLMSNLPLTPEKLAASNTLVAISLYELAQLYQKELEDYAQAVFTYHQSLERFPDSLYNGELYLNLYYCYNKLGLRDKAAYYKNLLNKNFASSPATALANNPEAANPGGKNAEGTKRYAAIYNLFIEGHFAQAFIQKRFADSIYGTNYWTPQLLYIEAVYHIRQRKDSMAISVLNKIFELYPTSNLAPKAERMIDVLKRRKEIEDYLTKLEITRAKDDEIVKIDDDLPKPVRNDTTLIVSPESGIDTNTKAPPPVPGVKIPEKIDEKAPAKKDAAVVVAPPILVPGKDTTSIKVPPTVPVIDMPEKIEDKAPSKKDTTVTIAPPILIPGKDTTKKAPGQYTNGPFHLNTAVPHHVVMVLDKVDGTYVNESKNAFDRYLNESFRGKPISLVRDAIDKDRSLIIFTSFANADAAFEFLQQVQKDAPVEVSWLPANKYSFILISEDNLQLLKTNKDIPAYLGVLDKAFPGRF